MADGGTVKIDITGDIADFLAAMEKTEDSAKKTGTAIGDIFKGVMASQLVTKGISMITNGIRAAANGAISLGKSVVSAYADYEQLVGGIDTLFKGSSDTVQRYAENAYKTAGLSANAYMETVTSFSASLISSLGGDTAKAAEMADMAITDMSDNANKMGSDMSSIQNAYQGFAKQNYTMLDNLKLGYGGTKEEMERLLKDAEKISGVKYDISSYADIVSAIHVIQTEMDITGTTAKEAEATISGSINTLKGAFENLLVGMGDPSADIGELFGNVTEALTNVINNIMPVVQNVFNQVLPQLVDMVSNALPSLMDGIMSAIPTIVQSLFGVLKNVVSQLAAKLPDLVKDLMKGLPAALRGILDMLPELIDMAIELATNIITGLIEALPELVPMLVEGIVRIVPKIFMGVAKAVANIGASIWDMLMGSPEDMTERVNNAFNNIDTSGIDPIIAKVKADVQTDVEFDGDPAAVIKEKVNEIRSAIMSIEGISEEDKRALVEAILTGSGIDVVQAAFDAMGIDSTVATQITQAMTDINNAVKSLGLSEDAQAHLMALLADDNTTKEEIEEYLISVGVDPTVAKDAAQTIYDADDTMDTALKALGFSDAEIAELEAGALDDKTAIVAVLKKLGLSDADIQSVLDSYDAASVSISGSMWGLYGHIKDIFTDGKMETPEDIAEARSAVEKYVQDALDDLTKWRDDKLKAIEESGLEGDELDAAVAEVMNVYDEGTQTIKDMGAAALGYITDYQNGSTEACEAGMVMLEEIADRAGVIEKKMADIEANIFGSTGDKKRRLVENGLQDQEMQLYALQYTDYEYEEELAKAEEEREAALEEAAEAANGNVEKYEELAAKAEEEYQAKVAAAEANKKSHQDKILQGILSGDEDAQKALDAYEKTKETYDKILEGLGTDFEPETRPTAWQLQDWFEGLGLDITPEEMAKALGLNNTDELWDKFADEIEDPDSDVLEGKFSNVIETAFGEFEIDLSKTKAGETIAAAVNEGWLEPAVDELGKYDYAGMIEDALDLEGGLEDAGENGGEALETGLSKKETEVYKAAWRLGMKIKNGVTDALEIASPSKVMRELGDFAGQGLDIGLTESVGAAIDNMRNLVTGINMAPKMDLSTIQGQLNSINEAQNEGNIVLQLNGRELGRAAAPDMNTAVNGYTRRIAMGYGRG